MKKEIILNKLILQTFNLLKSNTVLIMPLLLFLLLLVTILAPLGGVNIFIMLAILAMKSVFVAGWFNMFHVCIKNNTNDNLSDDEKVLNSLGLYKEFFPGVGMHFRKIFLGMLIYVLAINLAESLIFHFFANFESFSIPDFMTAMHNASSNSDIVKYWESVTPVDKITIYKLAIIDMSFILLFSYLTMFWALFVVVEEKSVLKSFRESVRVVFNDPLNTFAVFASAIFAFICILGLNLLLGSNAIGQLLFLVLTTYAVVYFIMMTFLYFERYR